MIVLEDRRSLSRDIHRAHRAGARLRRPARSRGSTCAPCNAGRRMAGSSPATSAAFDPADARARFDRSGAAPGARVANEPRFAWCPRRGSCRCSPTKACTSRASPASHACCARTGRAATWSCAVHRTPRPAHHAYRQGTRQVWCWDMTFLPAVVGAMVLPVPDLGSVQSEDRGLGSPRTR